MFVDRDEFRVTYNTAQLSDQSLIDEVAKIGFTAELVDDDVRQRLNPSAPPAGVDPPFFTAAMASARDQGKPLVVIFSADWCAPCQRMKKETFTDPDVSRRLEQCVVVEVDADRHIGLVKKFSVAGLPDIRLLLSDGSEHKQLLDFQTSEALSASLDDLLGSQDPKP